MTMQHTLKKGKRQVDVTPAEIQAECLAIRSEWSFSHRVAAMTDVTVARLQPDWDPAWDREPEKGTDGDGRETF